MNHITIQNLCKAFGEKKVLDNFSATFPVGTVSCIMAPSGAGKTTLLSIMQGLLRPDSGSMEGIPAKMAAVFQEDRLCEDFNAVSNVRFSCGSKSHKKSKEEITACLVSLGLGDSLDKPVRSFSGGMKRRVAIARALMADYELLFLDEPFKGLDEKLKISVAKYIKVSAAGKTVIAVSHDEAEAALLGATIIKM